MAMFDLVFELMLELLLVKLPRPDDYLRGPTQGCELTSPGMQQVGYSSSHSTANMQYASDVPLINSVMIDD